MESTGILETSIYVVGVGAATPVGRSALSVASAVRCGLAAFTEHPFVTDKHGEPVVVARAKWLSTDVSVEQRIASLAVDSAREALSPLLGAPGRASPKVKAIVALSADNLLDSARCGTVLESFIREVGPPILHEVECISEGHAGGLLALENACRALRRGEAQICLVGGADSWLTPERLEALDAAGRLHSINHSWGFIPGEGAGFCLITTGAFVRRLGLRPLAELLGVATAYETKLMGTRTVCIGEGLTDAFRGVLDPRDRVSCSYCDLNGETYRADEFGFAVSRMSDCFEDASRFTTAAECWGDVGAASGLTALALPVAGWARGYDSGEVALVWSSSADRPLRGAARVKRWGSR